MIKTHWRLLTHRQKKWSEHGLKILLPWDFLSHVVIILFLEQSELQQDRKRIWQLLFRYIVLLATEHKNDLRIVTQGAYEQKIISISYFLKVEEVGIYWFYHILNKKLTSAYNLKIAISNAYSSFRCLSLPNISMHFCKSVVLSTRY